MISISIYSIWAATYFQDNLLLKNLFLGTIMWRKETLNWTEQITLCDVKRLWTELNRYHRGDLKVSNNLNTVRKFEFIHPSFHLPLNFTGKALGDQILRWLDVDSRYWHEVTLHWHFMNFLWKKNKQCN